MINIAGDSNSLMEMANVRGASVKTDDIDFSFYFSNNEGNPNGIRARICRSRDKISISHIDGFMKLHGDYEYISIRGENTSSDKIENARNFFRKYKVLFAGVWEEKISEDVVQDYFRNLNNIQSICEELNIKQEINTIDELERYVRKYNLYDMND